MKKGKKMKIIFEWFGGSVVVAVLTFIIFLYLIELWCFIKCFQSKKFEKCFNKKCKFHKLCFRYEDVLTEKDIEELEKFLEQF